VNVRRRYSHGLSLLANYTFAKNLTNAPDFRSPMDESSIPQNDNDLGAEKGPGCDIRHRFCPECRVRHSRVPARGLDALRDAELEFFDDLPVSDGDALHDFLCSATRQTRETVLGENPIRSQHHGAAHLRSRNTHRSGMV